MKFFIKRTAAGRIYLSQIAPTDSEDIVSEIDADTWIRAREKIPLGSYEHREGHGYFS